MRLAFFFLLLFANNFSYAQTSLTKEQINRLADAGKIYGYVKYFHPFLQYKNINWDSSFAANVDEIIDAKNREEFTAILQRMFSVLDDNLTTPTIVPKKDTAYKIQFTTYNIKDSILYVAMNDSPLGYTWSSLQTELKNIDKVKGVIFDLRRPVNSPLFDWPNAGALDWTTSYYKEDLLMPSNRTMGYMGLNWDTYFKLSSLRPMHGDAKKEVPLVFIASKQGEIPVMALVLQQKGKAAIIQEEGAKLLPGSTVNFYIYDSILIRLRTGEAVSQEGFLLSVQPDETWKSSEPLSIAINKAEKLITGGFKKNVRATNYAPLSIIRTSNYTNQKYPSIGYRMLAAASIFSTIDNFFTDKNLMDKNWEASYKELIPKFIQAKDSLEYMQAVAELYANISDSHGYISKTSDGFSLRLNPVIQGRGNYIPPVITKVIENKVVVTGIYNDSACEAIGIKKGDVVLSVNGKNAMQMLADARKYQPASTKPSLDFYVGSFILFGRKDEVHKLKVQNKDGKIRDLSMPTLSEYKGDFWPPDEYSYRILSFSEYAPVKTLTKDIGYADLTSKLNNADKDSIINRLKYTKAFIFDLRGYPHDDFDINSLFDILRKNDKIVGGGKEIILAPSSPNINSNVDTRITTTDLGSSTNKASWIYPGQVVVLTNESAQSAAEWMCGTLKAVSDATIIGSPTAGANGGVASFNIPGNITLHFSQLGLLLPNGKSFQRYGIQPDILIQPTIKGIQAGKDEVLERAIKFIQTGK